MHLSDLPLFLPMLVQGSVEIATVPVAEYLSAFIVDMSISSGIQTPTRQPPLAGHFQSLPLNECLFHFHRINISNPRPHHRCSQRPHAVRNPWNSSSCEYSSNTVTLIVTAPGRDAEAIDIAIDNVTPCPSSPRPWPSCISTTYQQG